IVVLIGGFTTNFIWWVWLNFRNRTGHQYFSAKPDGMNNSATLLETAIDAPSRGMVEHAPSHTALLEKAATRQRVPMTKKYLLCALAGTTWYFQFFFYTMGETQMGQYKFSSWTLHMASIIIFSSLWGIGLKEWKGSGKIAGSLLALALVLLVGSTVIVGYGNYLGLAH